MDRHRPRSSGDTSSVNGGTILPWVAALVVGVPVALWTGYQAYRRLTPYKKDQFDRWNTKKSVLDDLIDEGTDYEEQVLGCISKKFRKAFPFRSFTLETFLNGKMSEAEYERALFDIQKCIAETNNAIWTAAGVKDGQSMWQEDELKYKWRQQRLKEHPELYPPGRRKLRMGDEGASEYIRRFYEAERGAAKNRQPDSDKADDGNDNKGDSSVKFHEVPRPEQAILNEHLRTEPQPPPLLLFPWWARIPTYA